jgi:hypothetical protein
VFCQYRQNHHSTDALRTTLNADGVSQATSPAALLRQVTQAALDTWPTGSRQTLHLSAWPPALLQECAAICPAVVHAILAEVAQGFGGGTGLRAGSARLADVAQGFHGGRGVELGPAVFTEVAQGFGAGKGLALGPGLRLREVCMEGSAVDMEVVPDTPPSCPASPDLPGKHPVNLPYICGPENRVPEASCGTALRSP